MQFVLGFLASKGCKQVFWIHHQRLPHLCKFYVWLFRRKPAPSEIDNSPCFWEGRNPIGRDRFEFDSLIEQCRIVKLDNRWSDHYAVTQNDVTVAEIIEAA